MYKDKDKQRQAQRERSRRYRDKAKGVTSKGVTGQGVTYRKGLATPSAIADIQALRTIGTPEEPLTRDELIERHRRARASHPQIQAIWDRRNAQGQPAAYTEACRPIPEAR